MRSAIDYRFIFDFVPQYTFGIGVLRLDRLTPLSPNAIIV